MSNTRFIYTPEDIKLMLEAAKPKKATKGGPGSGNWGHRGVPGQRGGSAGGAGGGDFPKSGEPYVTVYHATDDEFADSIKNTGLKRGGTWFGRPPAVYYVTDKEEAFKYATKWAGKDRVAVVTARVPSSMLDKAVNDKIANKDFRTKTAAYIELDIPASMLVSIDIYSKVDRRGRPIRGNWGYARSLVHESAVALKESTTDIYVVFALTGKSTKKETKSYVIEMKGGPNSK